jgi:hypothetical protein
MLTETAIQTLTNETAEQLNGILRNWSATADSDTNGPYVKLTKNTSDDESRRLLLDVLDEQDDKSDLTRYCWHYWNVTRSQWHVSELSPDAGINEIIDFLMHHLDVE